MVTDKGHVEHQKMHLEEKVSLSEIKGIVEIINKHIVGTPIDEVSMKLEYEVKPVIKGEIKQKEILFNAFYNVFNDLGSVQNVKVTNTSNMLREPEFNDASKMRNILEKFEDKDIIGNIKEDEEGIHIYIGSENEFDDDVTVIKTKYSVDGEEGTIALVGPKRMEYDRVITLLNYIVENIERK